VSPPTKKLQKVPKKKKQKPRKKKQEANVKLDKDDFSIYDPSQFSSFDAPQWLDAELEWCVGLYGNLTTCIDVQSILSSMIY
jgi:hypothetical protein